MASQRLNFVLTGRDELSRTLNGAGDSAARLHRRISAATTNSSAAYNRFTTDARRRLDELRASMGRAADSTQSMSGGLPSLTSHLGDVADAGQNAADSLGKSGGGLGGSMQGIAAVAGLSLLPALGAVVPMMAGMGLASGTLKLGLSGVGEAMEAQSKGAKEYKEALKKLSPEARTFTKSLVGVKKEFGGIGKDIQKAMLPGFTSAVKDAGPLVKILRRNMVDLGGTFGDLGKRAGKVFKDSGFQKDLQTNLTLGKRFVGDMASGVGTLGRSFLSFGAASKPTLTALSSGIRDVLGKGLPGMFDGLKVGIAGSASLLDGIFSALGRVLPAIGRFAGETARALGPLLGQALQDVGMTSSTVLDLLGKGMKALSPVFKDLGFGLKSIMQLMQIFGPTLKDIGTALVGSFLPSFAEVDKARGPLQRLSDTINNNKGAIQEFARQGGEGFLTLVEIGVQNLPTLLSVFRTVTGGMVTALGGVLHAAASAFGWVPGIGDKLKSADRKFGEFRDSYISGLATAEAKAKSFAASTGPKLAAGKLQLNINSWQAQLKTAKGQLASVPPSKRSALLAKIDDLKAKIRQGKGQLASLKDRTVNVNGKDRASGIIGSIQRMLDNLPRQRNLFVTTHYNQVRDGNVAKPFPNWRGGILKRAGGGPISGPGTGRSDSIPVLASNGEFMVNARSTAKHRGLVEAINDDRVPHGLGSLGGDVGRGLAAGMSGSLGTVTSGARSMAGAIITAMKDELQIASPSKRTKALAKDVGKGLIAGLTGSKSKIQATSKDLAKDIWSAFTGRKDNRLVSWVNKQTKTLLDLAGKRDGLAAKIKAAKEFSSTTRTGAVKSAGLGTLFEADEKVTAAGIAAKLKTKLAKMKTFTSYVNTLAKRGLNKTMLREILEMGPEEGYAYASALAGTNSKLLKQINSTQSGINSQASKLGNAGADALYDSGKNAGKGFLKGLTSQQDAIEKQMLKIAKGMDKAIRRALGIKSPSRVMAQIGRYTTEGLAAGLTERTPVLDRALAEVSGRVAATRPVLGRPVVAAGAGGGMVVNVAIGNAMDPVAVAREFQKVLVKYGRAQGTTVSLSAG